MSSTTDTAQVIAQYAMFVPWLRQLLKREPVAVPATVPVEDRR
jgi:hypothetical protein